MTSFPLPLALVLEEEYVRLYGMDHPRLRSRWTVQPDEIIDAVGLARAIDDLTESVAGSHAQSAGNVREGDCSPGTLAREINELLTNLTTDRKWLFQDERFAAAGRGPFEDLEVSDDLDHDSMFNVNRQMFDELFAQYVRPAADARFAEVVARIHERARQGQLRTALSVSGGGIRSATFALGVLQGLARLHILDKFDYLSTVSGGGYIGSWLSSWVRRHPWGIRGVASELAAKPENPLDPEPSPVRHLRAFSNYLTPKLGILSADTWALIATYARNLLLNWIVLIPLLVGVLALPRAMVNAVLRVPRGEVSEGAIAVGVIGSALLLLGLVKLVRSRPIGDRDERAMTDGVFVKYTLLPLLAGSIGFTLMWAWLTRTVGFHPHSGWALWWRLALGATIVCLIAFANFALRFREASFVERRMQPGEQDRARKRVWLELFGSVAAGLVGGSLLWIAMTQWFRAPAADYELLEAIRWPLGIMPIDTTTIGYVTFAVPTLLGILFLQATIFVGFSSQQNHDFDREWWARASGWVLLTGLAWIVLSAISLYGPMAIYYLPRALVAVGGVAGLFSLVAGRSGGTEAGTKKKGEESKGAVALNVALSVAVPLFLIFLVALVSTGTTWLVAKIENRPQLADHSMVESGATASIEERATNLARRRSSQHLRTVQEANWMLLWFGFVIGGPALALALSRAIGVNVFSMHAMYRNRLVRAYLGASRGLERAPNAFTGFDARDNLGMHELRPEYLWPASFASTDRAAKLLSGAQSPSALRFLYELIVEQLTAKGVQQLCDRTQTERRDRDLALAESLNSIIASEDLPALYQKWQTKPDGGIPKREAATSRIEQAERNRRFVERAFGEDQLYPAAMPLLCAQDFLVDDEQVLNAFHPSLSPSAYAVRALLDHRRPNGVPALLEAINDVIEHGQLADVPPFKSVDIGDAGKPFDVQGFPLHRMIENRLRLEAMFPKIIAPLTLARPLHVVNVCLNLTNGRDLAWQERKAESFTFTPFAAGNQRLGYRDVRDYGDRVSVGTAVTISGAAASPNMGYHSSPALAFLMTLFNVRLGWWLGNPGFAGNTTFRRRNPRWSLGPLVQEATGNSNDTYKYVYLSDGGHFENLGIYEMVLRRVHRIVVSDAGADPQYAYDDLGNAVRKIRIDLGVPIDITHIGIIPPTDKKPGKYCAVGVIRYKDVDGPEAVNGKLLYIKPVVYDEQGPRDVLNYSKNSADFPHESTADQFFSETQFESYRRLGYFAIEQIANGNLEPTTLDDLIAGAERQLPRKSLPQRIAEVFRKPS